MIRLKETKPEYLKKAIDLLPEELKAIAWKRMVVGKTYKDIALEHGMTYEMVRNRVDKIERMFNTPPYSLAYYYGK